jgi:hypothetical protein
VPNPEGNGNEVGKTARSEVSGCNSSFDAQLSMLEVFAFLIMTHPPLHRWKSFWLGLLVLAFLGWSWVRSMDYVEGILWMPRHLNISAGQAFGSVSLNWDGSRPPTPYPIFSWIHEAAPAGEPWFHKAMNWETYDQQLQLTVAHWLLILLFLLTWTAFLLWRYRRMKRFAVTAGSAEET